MKLRLSVFLKTLPVLLLSALLLVSNASSQDIPEELLEALGVVSPGDDDNINNLQVSVEDPRAGLSSDYQINLEVRESIYEQLRHGGFRFAFPTGFSLGNIHSIDLVDNCPTFTLEIESYSAVGQVLTINLIQVTPDGEEILGSEEVTVDVSFTVRSIGNPTVAGMYSIAALAFKQNNFVVAGPVLSAPFAITPGKLNQIIVSPQDDVSVRAGEVIPFSATGYDQYGNVIAGLTFSWSLDCGDCLGGFSGSVLYTTTVGEGRAVARSGGVSGLSGLITVLPGELGAIDLALSQTQFVGHPLRGEATATLYDAYGNLKTDYSLADDPFYLSAGEGQLDPDELSDNNLVSGGVVQILDAGVVYTGLSTTTDFVVDNDAGVSGAAEVSFNGYDILDAIDASGNTISTVYTDDGTVHTVARVIIERGGNLAPTGYVEINVRFLSDPLGQGVGIPVEELSSGPDTIEVTLPDIQHPSGQATLQIVLDADFELEGELFATSDTTQYLVEVVQLEPFAVVEDSFEPDEVTEGLPFDISFDVFSDGFSGPVDSVSLVIRLRDEIDGDVLATLYSGSPEPVSVGGGTVSFADLQAVVPELSVVAEGWYPVEVALTIRSLSAVVTLSDRYPDSLYVRKGPMLSVDPTTVAPTTVAAGSVVSFSFDLEYDGTGALGLDADIGTLTVYNNLFSSAVDLFSDQDSIYPGTNHFFSAGVYIPTDQEGNQLSLEGVVRYLVGSTSPTQSFTTDFSGLTIPVTGQPSVQIVNVDVVAPNAPKVNTLQQFQISCLVTNHGEIPVGSLILRLSSDGNSSFNSQTSPIVIDPEDTVEVLWDVVAASEPNPAEIFIVDVVASEISILTPDDNVTLVTIETPADLELTHDLFGVEDGLTSYGNDVVLTVELVNHGMAAITGSQYMLVSEGFDSDGPDTLLGQISADKHIDFSFIAPQHDTSISLFFSLTGRPTDLNAGLPAAIGDTSFSISFDVIFAEAALFVEALALGPNVVLPGREKDLIQLNLTNTGISSVTTIQLDRIHLVVNSSSGAPVNAMSVFNISNTAFCEDGLPVSTTTAGDSLIVFGFDEFIIGPRTTRSLIMRVEFEQTDLDAVSLVLPRDGIAARFTSGPNAGMAPAINSDTEGETLLTQPVAVQDGSLGGSFMIETNPFNPEDLSQSPVNFIYELTGDAAVEFRIFSVIGEEVYAVDFPAGTEGGSDGENIIQWDGRNNSGYMVVNGVYIAMMINTRTGETATIKVAVVK